MGKVARSAALAMALSACALSAAPASAQQAPPETPADIGRECRARGGSQAMCLGFEKLAERAAAECRRLGVEESRCVLPLGKTVLRGRIADYERGHTHRVLGLQYALANDVPLRDAPFPGTHNSFNNTAELPTLSHTDSNQQLSLTDQLRMDIRSVELDAHWFPTQRAGGRRAVVVCHATDQDAGCTTERLLSENLRDLAAWLRGHRDQVLLLYIEDDIRGTTAAETRKGHAAARHVLLRELGRYLYRPAPRAGKACAALPLGLSRRRVLAAGKQVIAVSTCVGAWGDAFFDWGPSHVESRPQGYRDFPTCDQDPDGDGKPEFGRSVYRSKMVRYYQDSTFVTAAAATPDDGLPPATAARMVRCGVDLFGFDQLLPGDGRLPALVWSWAPSQPATHAGRCAAQRGDGRWVVRSCSVRRRPACRAPDGSWVVGRVAVPYIEARERCRRRGAVFAVPRTGYENQLLRTARTGGEVWLGHRLIGGRWITADLRSSANRSLPRPLRRPRLRLRFGFRRGKTRSGRTCARSRVRARVLGRDGPRVRRVLLVRGRRHFRVDRRAPFRRIVHRRHRGRSHRHRVRARVRMKDGRVVRFRRSFRACRRR